MTANAHDGNRLPRRADAMLAAWLRVPHVLRWLAPIAVMAALWWSSSRSPGDAPPSVLRAVAYNGMHVVAYAVLAAATWLAWPKHRAGAVGVARAASIAAMAVAIGYGVVDELHQGHVPGRMPSVADVLTDAFGALLAVCLLRAWVTAAPLSARLLAWLVLACAGSVAFATWGPW